MVELPKKQKSAKLVYFFLVFAVLIISLPLSIWVVRNQNLNTKKQASLSLSRLKTLPKSETINFLDYFLPSRNITLCTDDGQGNCDDRGGGGINGRLALWQVNNNLFTVKDNQAQRYEHHAWDDEYVYLKYDNSWPTTDYHCDGFGTSYAPTDAKLAKLRMSVGESVISPDNEIVIYDNDCQVCETTSLIVIHTLESHFPEYDFGGDVGVADAIVIRVNSVYDDTYAERFYYAKGWGWVMWELYNDNQLQYQIPFNKIDELNPPLEPEIKCSDKSIKTCSIKLKEASAINPVFSVSAFSFESPRENAARLWLERQDGQRIENFSGGREGHYFDKYFYFLENFDSSSLAISQDVKISGLPDGEYFIHCDIDETANVCSGNPFCQYEGGDDDCGDVISCSDSDNYSFIIDNSSAYVTPTLNLSPTPTIKKGVGYTIPPTHGIGETRPGFLPCTACDLDQDNDVDQDDLDILADCFGQTVPNGSVCDERDIRPDGVINIFDFVFCGGICISD